MQMAIQRCFGYTGSRVRIPPSRQIVCLNMNVCIDDYSLLSSSRVKSWLSPASNNEMHEPIKRRNIHGKGNCLIQSLQGSSLLQCQYEGIKRLGMVNPLDNLDKQFIFKTYGKHEYIM